MSLIHPSLDALIVLGARLNPRGEPGRIARLRLLHGLELWRDLCPQGRLILTGGVSGLATVSEARAMADWALKWVEESWGLEALAQLAPRLVLEEASLNTAASAANTLVLARKLNLRAVGLVSDGLHLKRAHYLFRRHFNRHHLSLHPFPVPGVLNHYWRRRRYLGLGKMIIREGGAWLKLLGRRALEK